MSLVENATNVDNVIYDALIKWKNELPEKEKSIYPDFPSLVKNKLKEDLKKIWVHNFPWTTPEELLNIKKIDENVNHDLELFGLKKEFINKENLKNSFLVSKITMLAVSFRRIPLSPTCTPPSG